MIRIYTDVGEFSFIRHLPYKTTFTQLITKHILSNHIGETGNRIKPYNNRQTTALIKMPPGTMYLSLRLEAQTNFRIDCQVLIES